jgi:hypothetical protein
MNDWHLRANFENGVQTGGTVRYVHLFTLDRHRHPAHRLHQFHEPRHRPLANSAPKK